MLIRPTPRQDVGSLWCMFVVRAADRCRLDTTRDRTNRHRLGRRTSRSRRSRLRGRLVVLPRHPPGQPAADQLEGNALH